SGSRSAGRAAQARRRANARAGATGARGPATAPTEAAAGSAGAADVQATDVTLAQHGVPGLLHLAGGIGGDAVVLAVVEQDVGVTHAGGRAVQVVDGQALVGTGTAVVVVEPPVDVREVHRLGIDVLRALDGVLGGDAGAGEQQPGQRARLAGLVVLVVHERGVRHVDAIVVVLVATDREVGDLR